MKRSLPPDYNPVYPFGTKRLNLMPPFFNSQGFTDEAPDATLSLNIERPLSYTPQGALQLAVGRGFVIRNGILETNDLSSSVIPPLVRDNNNLVTLAVAGGLIVSQDALAVNPGMGLEINNHGVLVPKAAAPLQLSAADGLTLSFGDGLQAAGGALTPVLGDGLEIRDKAVSLRVGAGLELVDGLLRAIPPPVAQTVTVQPPLQQSADGQLSVSLGLGLMLSRSGAISVNAGLGLTIGLTSSGLFDVRLHPAPPLTFDGQGRLTLNTGDGLQNNSGSIGVNTGRGININTATRAMEVVAGKGLEYTTTDQGDGDALTVKLGPGLRFSPDGGIAVGPSLVQGTLWTTFRPPYNLTWESYTAPGAKLYLSLVRTTEGLVIGNVAVESTTINGLFVDKSSGPLTCWIPLTTGGELAAYSSLSGPWVLKDGTALQKSDFLPSSTLYPIETDTRVTVGRSYISQTVYFANTLGSMLMQIRLNTRRSADYPASYGIHFWWGQFSLPDRREFTTTSATFTYWT